MAGKGLDRQSDIEELVAWMDGELPADQARRVAALLETDPRWQTTHRQFQDVDAAMDLLTTPSPSSDLTDRIVRAARRQQTVGRAVRIMGSLAAAAAIVVAVWLAWPADPRDAMPELPGAAALSDVPEQDRFLVRNLDLVRDLEEVVHYEQMRSVVDEQTLDALEAIEAEGKM